MQKISPLRASLDAFNKFKAKRSEVKTEAQKVHSNPFGITFKGTVLQMDVFENSLKEDKLAGIKEKMANVSKLTASAWVATINKFSNAKNSVISFGAKIKQDAKSFVDKLNNTKIEFDFDFMKNSVASLQKQPISNLEDMLKTQLKALGV